MGSPYEKLIREIKVIMHGIDEEIHDYDSPSKTVVSDDKYYSGSRAISQLAAMCRDLEEMQHWKRIDTNNT